MTGERLDQWKGNGCNRRIAGGGVIRNDVLQQGMQVPLPHATLACLLSGSQVYGGACEVVIEGCCPKTAAVAALLVHSRHMHAGQIDKGAGVTCTGACCILRALGIPGDTNARSITVTKSFAFARRIST